MNETEFRQNIINNKNHFLDAAVKAKEGLLNALPKDKPLDFYERHKVEMFNIAVKKLHDHHTSNEITLPMSGLKLGDSLKPNSHSKFCTCDTDLNELLIDTTQFDKKVENKPIEQISFTKPKALVINTQFDSTSSYLGPYSSVLQIHDSELEDNDSDN